jgi:hypothetical protein
MTTSEQPDAPAWIAALPGHEHARNYNHAITLAGGAWFYDDYTARPHLGMHLRPTIGSNVGMRILEIEETDDGRYRWHSSLCMIPAEWYVRATGLAATPEDAARAALEFIHVDIDVGGHTWYFGADDGLATAETRIGRETIQVGERQDGRWRWERGLDLAAFDAIGLHFIGRGLSGTTDTPRDAMHAALEAPLMMRFACRRYLADSAPEAQIDPQIIDFALTASKIAERIAAGA